MQILIFQVSANNSNSHMLKRSMFCVQNIEVHDRTVSCQIETPELQNLGINKNQTKINSLDSLQICVLLFLILF